MGARDAMHAHVRQAASGGQKPMPSTATLCLHVEEVSIDLPGKRPFAVSVTVNTVMSTLSAMGSITLPTTVCSL